MLALAQVLVQAQELSALSRSECCPAVPCPRMNSKEWLKTLPLLKIMLVSCLFDKLLLQKYAYYLKYLIKFDVVCNLI